MATPVNPPRGMRDFLPAEKAKREHALGIIRGVYRAHGFDEIETPVMEDWGRLHAGLGGDNEKLSFSVLRRGLRDEDLAAAAAAGDAEMLADLGLRFDLTVPLARFYASHRAELAPVFRAVQIAPVWRAERPQRGRYRQFVQADIDIIGESGLLAEIELIVASSEALAALGLQDCVIRVNDRRVLFGMLTHCGFSLGDAERSRGVQERALITIDKLDKIGAAGVLAELCAGEQIAGEVVFGEAAAEFDVRGATARLGEILSAIEPRLAAGIALQRSAIEAVLPGVGEDASAAEGIRNLAELGDALAGELPAGVSVVFDPSLVRGMGYYTGTIFEVAHPSSGSSVGGGGRYDGMVGRFLGQQVPAVGFSIGVERIIDLIDVPAVAGPESLVLVASRDASVADLSRVKRALISRGHRVRIEWRQKNMRALLDRVQAEGFTSMAYVGAGVREIAELELRPLG